MKISFLKSMRQILEAILTYFFCFLFRNIPLNISSNLAGFIARSVGQWTKASQKAKKRLKLIFPEMSDKEINRVLLGMWDNLGRVIVEYEQISKFWDGKTLHHIEIEGLEYLQEAIKQNKSCILFSAHIGSWQMITLAAQAYGMDLMQVYRAANNPWVDRKMAQVQKNAVAQLTTKGKKGAKDLMSALSKGGNVMMLVDQKMNDGIEVPFLGRPAMTAPAIARLAMRFNSIILPARCERINSTQFRVTFYPFISYDKQQDINEMSYKIMTEINEMIGEWVKNTPEQWLWIHNRWGD